LQDEELNGWKLVRNIDGQERPEFLFTNITLQPLQKLKIWAAGSKPSNAAPTDLEYWESSWGTGTSVITKLINQADEDKATHVQKTVYS
jgi:intermediate filament protein if